MDLKSFFKANFRLTNRDGELDASLKEAGFHQVDSADDFNDWADAKDWCDANVGVDHHICTGYAGNSFWFDNENNTISSS